MTELFEKSIRVLELPQLLERLSQKAVSEAAKERALRLTPSTDADDVRRLQDETDAARALIGLRGSPSFSGVKDVREALARAERGGMLNPRELLTIAGLLTNSRRVREYYEADQGEGTVLDRMFDSLHANRFLEDKITTSILSEDEIADAASPELASIRRHIRATAAKVRVLITSTDGVREWTTVGVSSDVIEASWIALSDSIEYKLIKDKEELYTWE